jgi:L-lactate utilization protein LutB
LYWKIVSQIILGNADSSMLEEASFLSGRCSSVALIIDPATLFQKKERKKGKEKNERKERSNSFLDNSFYDSNDARRSSASMGVLEHWLTKHCWTNSPS